jgi:hypothetical protein
MQIFVLFSEETGSKETSSGVGMEVSSAFAAASF